MVGAAADAEALRPVAVRRLLALKSRGELTAGHRRMVADTLAVSERTVRRWLAAAREDGRLERAERRRFTVTSQLARRLAFHRGSVSALHRELTTEAGGRAVPSLATLYRAAARDVSPGLRAGMRGGEAARRDHDVFLQRPAGHRNEVWEADHVQVKVEVDIDGRPGRPWVTWLRAAHSHQGLARAGCHDHLRPQPPFGHSRPHRQFERAQHRVNGLALVGTESLRHVPLLCGLCCRW